MKPFYIACFSFFLITTPISSAQTGTWQQRVAYEMDIIVHPESHQFDGNQRLSYWNNSPDTLKTIFYHLYFNAFSPNSLMAERNRHLPDPDGRMVPRLFELGPDEIGFHQIGSLTQNGEPVPFDVHDTTLKVTLNDPIPPGGSSVFEMSFRSQVPLQTRRSGRDSRDGVDFSMSQWYPKVAGYDQRGWHADPYIGREFYGPFGSFDVRITIPREFVLGGTGVVQNKDEVGHGYADSQLSDENLTWHFKAENVHDFAWVADTDYIHRTTQLADGRPIHLLFLPQYADAWEPFVEVAPRIIDALSDEFGTYPHPQFTIALAGDGGMEYPMIIFNAGDRSLNSLIGVSIHEGAHQWFYSLLGSNESDYAWMDEGFTSYASTEIRGKYFADQPDPSHLGAYLRVYASRKLGWGEPFSTPSDWFDTNAGYGVAAYSGGEMMAEMLGYVISPELRDVFFKRYYDEFKFRHPEPHDIENLAERVSGLQLDWFFHQWLNTTWKNDYAVESMTSGMNGEKWKTTIRLARKERGVMPVDIRIELEDGSSQWVTIPSSEMLGHKPVADSWIIADAWGWTAEDYELIIDLPSKAVFVEIDPEGGMLDDNRLNNTSRRIPSEVVFMRAPQPSLFRYGSAWAPYFTYSNLFGVGAGVQMKGAYILNDHILDTQVTLFTTKPGDFEVDTFADVLTLINYDFSYDREIASLGTGTRLRIGFENHLGIVEDFAQLTRPVAPLWGDGAATVSVGVLHQDRISNTAYQGTSETAWNASNLLSGNLEYKQSKLNDFFQVGLQAGSTTGATLPFSSGLLLSIRAQKSFSLGKKSQAFARFQYTTGNRRLVEQNWAVPGIVDLASQWRSDTYRSLSGIFENPVSDGRFYAFSGVGPVGYLYRDGGYAAKPAVTTLASGSFVLDSGQLFTNQLLAPLQVQLFTGAAVSSEPALDKIIADAGIGVQYNVAELVPLQRWVAVSDVLSGMNLSARFPLWLSHPERISESEEAFAFRWLLGVETGF